MMNLASMAYFASGKYERIIYNSLITSYEFG